MVELVFSEELRNEYSDVFVPYATISGVEVATTQSPEFKARLAEISQQIREKFTLENLKDDALVRKYRTFFWRLNIDPTKTRPASEALIRRVLAGNFPQINNLVDIYNIVSLETGIPLAAFDLACVSGDVLTLRFATENEPFVGIGMKKPKILRGGEVVIADAERLVAIYPHRDADYTKVTLETKDVVILLCGAPGVSIKTLNSALDLAVEWISDFCGGYRTS
ncbi:MAG: B3/4 domain-containing protein [Candidatus Heimdallarchaeota archaeon]